MDVGVANSELADIVLVKHGPEPLNIEPRNSVCAARGVNFVEESSFVLGYGKRDWLMEEGCAFLTETGRLHRYSHLRGAPPDTVLCVRFTSPMLECLRDELPRVQFDRMEPVLGKRNDLRFLRWRLDRVLAQGSDLSIDEWVVELVVATCLSSKPRQWRDLHSGQFNWYAERIDAARQQLAQRSSDLHRLRRLARSVGMSTFQFARVFRELVGVAPHQYLLNVRYRSALHMLLGDASVTDACFKSGFSNLSHFTRQFKIRFGAPPSSVKALPLHLVQRRFLRRDAPCISRRFPEHK